MHCIRRCLMATATRYCNISLLIFVGAILLFLPTHNRNKQRVQHIAEAVQPPTAWRGRRIYQLLTDRFANPANPPASACNMNLYCGGTFSGIIDHLDYIAGLGFNAIWISPVPVNYENGYHGYWATNFFAVNPHFGTAQELEALVAACHKRDIWVMIDIVLNHVGPVGTAYGMVHPFNETSYYHQDCPVTEYQCESAQVLHCRLADLPDLNQSHPYVAQQLQQYVKWLLNTFGFDGIRADTVMYINNAFWKTVTDASGTLVAGEVWSDWGCQQNYIHNGVTSTLNYDLFYKIRDVFQNAGSMRQLGEQWRRVQALPFPFLEVNFVDNHDNDRFLHHGGLSLSLYYSALSHLMFQTGIPVVLYGTEQYFSGGISDNYCRQPLWPTHFDTSTQMYQFLKRANEAYEQLGIGDDEAYELWQDDEMYCFSRGPVLHCAANTPGRQQTRSIPNLPFNEGDTVCDWYNPTGPCAAGAPQMSISIMSQGMPILLFKKQ